MGAPDPSEDKGEKSDKGSRQTRAKTTADQRPARLPSLRGPRDLTLGGVRKKTFTPNIPVRKERVKNESKDSQSPSAVKRDRPRRDRQRGRGRGRGRGRPEIIQSHSIFEAGPSAEVIKRSEFASCGTGGGGGTKDSIEKPTIKKEEYDEEFEKVKSAEALKSLAGDSPFIADLDNDDVLMPTFLPMSSSSWPPGGKALQDADAIKQEAKKTVSNKSEFAYKDCSSMFLSEDDYKDQSGLLIFQLPDTLPAVAPSNDCEIKTEPNQGKDTVKIKQEPGLPTPELEEKCCTLDQLSEGYVGKLQVLKSGHCRLLLGQVVLEMNMGTPTSFHEELVSVRLPLDEVSQGHMTVLGDIAHKIVCTPNMEQLILQTK